MDDILRPEAQGGIDGPSGVSLLTLAMAPKRLPAEGAEGLAGGTARGEELPKERKAELRLGASAEQMRQLLDAM